MTKKKGSAPKPITLAEIKKKSEGELIEIPDWNGRDTIWVRVRSVDVTAHLLEAGSLPNEVKMAVDEAFDSGAQSEEDLKRIRSKLSEGSEQNQQDRLRKMLPMLNAIAKEALIEPTYDEVNEVYPLNIQQKLAIFEYSTKGIDSMASFREEQSGGDAGTDTDEQDVRDKAK